MKLEIEHGYMGFQVKKKVSVFKHTSFRRDFQIIYTVSQTFLCYTNLKGYNIFSTIFEKLNKLLTVNRSLITTGKKLGKILIHCLVCI